MKDHPSLRKIWGYLSASDQLYYISTAGGGPGEVHNYFSPYGNPFDAALTFLAVLGDFDFRIKSEKLEGEYPFTFFEGPDRPVKTVTGLADFTEAVLEVPLKSLAFHAKEGHFSAWAAGAFENQKIARKFEKLEKKKLKGKKLREELHALCTKTVKKLRERQND